MMFEIHPAADPWPMLPDDELAELAQSIADVGLLEPLVVTPDGQLLDGRNRLHACVTAGVNPTTVTYDGDPVAFVLARNAHRRHMTRAQRATAAWLTAATDSQGISTRRLAQAHDLAQSDIVKAKAVADRRPDLLPHITNGDVTLHDAYDTARGVDRPPAEVAIIRRFITGWATFIALDELPDRDTILAALSDDERRTLDNIRRTLR